MSRRVALLGALLLAGACAPPAPDSAQSAPGENTAAGAVAAAPAEPVLRTAVTREGRYQVSIGPRSGEIPLRELHAWRVRVADAAGRPVTPERVVLDATMPGHGHGMDSKPAPSGIDEDGSVIVEGMRFQMAGDWSFSVRVLGPAGPDVASISWNIQPPVVPGIAATDWTALELARIRSLSLATLPPPPQDPSNRFSGDPAAIALGEALFFDPGLSADGSVSCATCHQSERHFTDGRRLGFGTGPTRRHTPTVLGLAWSNWYYWDGRRDSVWSQALTPLETPGEMSTTRVDALRYIMAHPLHSGAFARLAEVNTDFADPRFPQGAGPFATPAGRAAWAAMQPADREAVNGAFATVGKVIAAYEATLVPEASRFDRYADALLGGAGDAADQWLTPAQQRGLRLFVDEPRTHCMRCHNGPLFSNGSFHNIGTGAGIDGQPDAGRALGMQAALLDEFNCAGRFSDAAPEDCSELNHAATTHAQAGAFKVPGLRNVAATAPYLHDGRFANLDSVLAWYRNPPDKAQVSHELEAIELNRQEARDLVAFLGALSPPAKDAQKQLDDEHDHAGHDH